MPAGWGSVTKGHRESAIMAVCTGLQCTRPLLVPAGQGGGTHTSCQRLWLRSLYNQSQDWRLKIISLPIQTILQMPTHGGTNGSISSGPHRGSLSFPAREAPFNSRLLYFLAGRVSTGVCMWLPLKFPIHCMALGTKRQCPEGQRGYCPEKQHGGISQASFCGSSSHKGDESRRRAVGWSLPWQGGEAQ